MLCRYQTVALAQASAADVESCSFGIGGKKLAAAHAAEGLNAPVAAVGGFHIFRRGAGHVKLFGRYDRHHAHGTTTEYLAVRAMASHDHLWRHFCLKADFTAMALAVNFN